MLLGLAVAADHCRQLLLKEKPAAWSVAPQATQFICWKLLCSASLAAQRDDVAACWRVRYRLTASPDHSGDGLQPSDIGNEHHALPTLAFMAGGYGCRSALRRIKGRMLPWLLVAYCASMVELYWVAQPDKRWRPC